jgi:hypothetical protein
MQKESKVTALLVNTQHQHDLAAGKSGIWIWKNLTPHDAVWSVNAIPVPTGDTQKGFNEDASFEVTRVWRRMISTEDDPHSQTTTVTIKHELHYEVKNVGDGPGRFVAYLSAVS